MTMPFEAPGEYQFDESLQAFNQNLKASDAMWETQGEYLWSEPHQAKASDADPSAEPVRIAHIGPCLCRGGAEQQLIDLSKFFEPSRVQLTKCLVLPGGVLDPKVAADLHCPVERAHPELIAQTMKENDIVLFWGMQVDKHLHRLTNSRAKKLFLAHGDSWWTQNLLSNSRASIDHVIAVSEGVRRATCQGFRTTVIPNGVDTGRLATTRCREEVRKSLGFSEKDFLIGWVSRLAPEKNTECFIRALAKLPDRFKALIFGWGPLKGKLLELANDLIPNRYVFVSADCYLGDYYQSMDAFSLLSRNEGFALVILEAMSLGCRWWSLPWGPFPR